MPDIDYGIWYPIWASNSPLQGPNTPKYCEPLFFAKTDSSYFNACNCSSSGVDITQSTIDCSYCSTNAEVFWQLYDISGNVAPSEPFLASSCCEGICDTRLNIDDYLPKVPCLNQSMLTGFLDFKYLKQFPACNNPGLGVERFIKYDRSELAANGLTLTNCDMFIDWKLKECISEVPYDLLTSQHDSKYAHDKSYERALRNSKTAGNFIYLHDITDGDIPDVEAFKAPYGFDGSTNNNIFISGEKVASYWKWNYTSGILNWERYYGDGMEYFVGPGDFFYATLDGPEPSGTGIPISDGSGPQQCPSGLKIIDINGNVSNVISSGSHFVYISENIYPLFRNIYDRVRPITTGVLDAIYIAGTLATGPQYDDVTVDLFAGASGQIVKNSDGEYYKRNEFSQISGINKLMSAGMTYGSAFDLNFYSTKAELASNLKHKYGSYIWIPPRTTASIEISDTSNGFLDLDYDMVLDIDDIKHSNTNNQAEIPVNTPLATNCFTYNMSVDIGGQQVLYTDPFTTLLRQVRTCVPEERVTGGNTGIYPKFEVANTGFFCTLSFDGGVRSAKFEQPVFIDRYPRIVFNQDSIESYCKNCDSESTYIAFASGKSLCLKKEKFCDYTMADYIGNRVRREIADGSLTMKRNYYAQAINPRIDCIAMHPNYGSAVQSKIFELDKSKAFFKIDQSKENATRAGNVKINFRTYDVGIKIYNIKYESLQTNDSDTLTSKRFPVNYDDLCQCEPLVAQYPEYNYYPGTGPITIESMSYTPNVSTKYSPVIYKYGGYNRNYLNENFPRENLQENIRLSRLDYRIDPEFPLGKSSVAKSISLPNYHTSRWQIETTANNVSVLENGSVYGNSYNYREDGYGDFIEEMNTNWKRFRNRVEIQSLGQTQNIYHGQNTDFTPGIVGINLVNPMLESLTDGPMVLHPPTVTGANYFFDNVWGLFGTRGDEMSTVTLSFKNIQQKDLLYFNAKQLQDTTLNLQPVSFDIRTGPTQNSANYSNINSSGLIPFNNLSPPTANSKNISYIGNINNNFIKSLHNIYEIDKNKSPKLLIYFQNRLWQYVDDSTQKYQYTIPSQNSIYAGPALLYEYIFNTQNSSQIPYVAPIHKKYQPKLFARYNSIPYGLRNTVDKSDKIFDFLINKTTIDNTNGSLIRLPGIRHYFAVQDRQALFEVDIDFIDLDTLSQDIAQNIKYRDLVRFNGDQLFMYIGGSYGTDDKYELDNYLFMPDIESTRLFSNFCNLSLDFTSSIGTEIKDSKQFPSDHNIVLYDDRGRTIAKKVLEKSIHIQHYKDDGRKTTNINKSADFDLFTDLVIQGSLIPGQKYYIDAIDSSSNLAFVIYDNAKFVYNQEDKNILFPNILYGDLEKYDGNLLNQPIALGSFDFNLLPIPKSPYNNLFYKIILSDLQNDITFNFTNTVTRARYDISSSGIQYNILQKYALSDLYNEKFDISNLDNYANYLPVMDVNIFGEASSIVKNPNIEYEVTSNRLWSNTIDDENDSDGSKFILNLNKEARLYPIDQTQLKSTTIYGNTHAINLKEVKKIDNYRQNDAGIQRLIASKNFDTDLYRSRERFTVSQEREYPFLIYDIFSFPEGCAGELLDRECNAKFAGNIQLKSEIGFYSGVGDGSIPVSNLIGQPIVIGLAYDHGLGNNLSASNFYTTIKRAKDIDTSDTCMSANSGFLPEMIFQQKQDPAYWQRIQDIRPDANSIVAYTDDYANEMLFRILYGEEQKYNKERLFFEEEAITYAKLIDPLYEIEAKDIYKDIPYNYDRSAEMNNFYLDHNIVIYGTGGNNELVRLKIGDHLLQFRFNTSFPHKVTVNASGPEVSENYTVLLDQRQSSVQDYIVVADGVDPPEGARNVGRINNIGGETGYGWTSYRVYTGDPYKFPGCSPTSAGDTIIFCPTQDNPPAGASRFDVDNGGCYCTTNPVPTKQAIYDPGTPATCDDGTSWPIGPICAKYGYFPKDTSSLGCEEFRNATDIVERSYYFEDCRTAFRLKAGVGRSDTGGGQGGPADYAAPSTTYEVQGYCSEGNCRGYQLGYRIVCGGGLPVIHEANGFKETCDNQGPYSYPTNPDADGCISTRDPGYDVCGMTTSVGDTTGLQGSIYQYTALRQSGEYSPAVCPIELISVNYTTDSIKISIAGDVKCLDIPFQQACKKISLTLPNRDYYITETIGSACDSSSQIPSLSFTETGGKQTFLTVDTILKFPIGSFTAADINSGPSALAGRDSVFQCDRGSDGNASLNSWVSISICGQGGAPWIPLEDTSVIDYHGLAGAMIAQFQSRVSSLASTLSLAGNPTPSVDFIAQIARWAQNVNYAPASELIRGPTGGGSVVFDTESKTKRKFNNTGESTYTETTVTAYLAVPYRIPKSMAALVGESTGALICDNTYDNNIQHIFPDWYADLIGASSYDTIAARYYNPPTYSNNFAMMNSDFSITCEGLTSNYNKDVLDSRIIIRPCPRTDYDCWANQGGWTPTIGRDWR